MAATLTQCPGSRRDGHRCTNQTRGGRWCGKCLGTRHPAVRAAGVDHATLGRDPYDDHEAAPVRSGYDTPLPDDEIAAIAAYDPADYPNGSNRTVDAVVLTDLPDGRLGVVTITRAKPPYAGQRALPGGFVDPGEDPADAARRELAEETGLDPSEIHATPLPRQRNAVRDPRMPMSTAPYALVVPYATVSGAHAGDDAAEVHITPIDEIADQRQVLAFDHARIVRDAVAHVRPDHEHLGALDTAADAADRRNRQVSQRVERARWAAGRTVAPIDDVLRGWHPDVTLDIRERDDGVILDRIVVPDSKRRSGIGSEIMRDLCAYADASAKTAALTPAADFGSSRKRLTEFYGRFGFKANKGRSRDLSFRETMIRLPR